MIGKAAAVMSVLGKVTAENMRASIMHRAYEGLSAGALVNLVSYMPSRESVPDEDWGWDDTKVERAKDQAGEFFDRVNRAHGSGIPAHELNNLLVGDLLDWIKAKGNKEVGSNEMNMQRRLLAEAEQQKNSAELVHVQVQDQDKDGCFVVFKNGAKATIVFRGSQIKRDWWNNVQFLMRRTDIDGHSVLVHTGFYGILCDKPQREELGDVPLLDRIKEVLDKEQLTTGDYELSIVGHSLGGALATLCGLLLAREMSTTFKGPITVISFAAPRVGNVDFRRAHQAAEASGRLNHVRIMGIDDIVPTIPISPRRYTHVGARVVLKPVDEAGPVASPFVIEYPDVDKIQKTSPISNFWSTKASTHYIWIYLKRISAAISDAAEDPNNPRLTVEGAFHKFFDANGKVTEDAERGISFYSSDFLD